MFQLAFLVRRRSTDLHLYIPTEVGKDPYPMANNGKPVSLGSEPEKRIQDSLATYNLASNFIIIQAYHLSSEG